MVGLASDAIAERLHWVSGDISVGPLDQDLGAQSRPAPREHFAIRQVGVDVHRAVAVFSLAGLVGSHYLAPCAVGDGPSVGVRRCAQYQCDRETDSFHVSCFFAFMPSKRGVTSWL